MKKGLFKPVRTCAGCGCRRDKAGLLRILRTPEGEIRIDREQRGDGRGVYLCRSRDCLAKAQKRKALARSLKCTVPQTLFDELREETDDRTSG
ncbi:MAG: YlxR family protein [Eubacterium sp.]|nr:YlxR family protein [Eubacterium sp.]